MVDTSNLHKLAKEIGVRAAKKVFNAAHEDALNRLEQAKPLIDILQQQGVHVSITGNSEKQKGFSIIAEMTPSEEIFVAQIERIADTYLDRGTILFPCGFGEYIERLKAVTRCHETLADHQIASGIIANATEGIAILFVPPFIS